MIVFKKYLKVANTYTPLILLYTVIFLVMTIFVGTFNSSSIDYQATDINVAIINHDSNTWLIDSLKDYVGDNGNLVELQDNEEALRDALFYRKVDYIMIVPENYTNDFIAGKNVDIETMELPDAYNSVYSKNLLNRFLNTANLYLQAGVDENQISTLIKQDLSNEADVSMLEQKSDVDFTMVTTYYNFLNYMLLTIAIVIISMVMVSFNEEKIMRRNLIAPISYKKMNRQLLLGNCTLGLLLWLLYISISFILYPKAMFTINGALLVLNSFALLIFIEVLSFLITKITSNREILSGIGNVFSLGSSFLCGAFVPQSMLSPLVLTIGKCLPSYWFIKANNEIVKLTSFTLESLLPIFIDIIIILGFALIAYVLMQFISRWQLKR